MKQETIEEAAERLANYRQNAEEDYTKVPISVLRYISELERQQEQDKNNEKELYSEIEYLIINWSNDGTKTAGALTRQIIEQFKKK